MKTKTLSFSEQIKAERVRLGLTQAEAATLCNVSPRVWWQWESGRGSTLHVTQEGVLARLRKAQPVAA